MNKLNLEKQAQIIKVLCEGNSIRSTARITDTAINTVVKLLREVGAACMEYHNAIMHNLPCQKLQCDEIWSFVYSKNPKGRVPRALPVGEWEFLNAGNMRIQMGLPNKLQLAGISAFRSSFA